MNMPEVILIPNLWNGSAWVRATDWLVWNGTQWATPQAILIWNGADWVDAA